MTNQTPIKVECENCGYGRPWPGRYAEELEAAKADLLAALEALLGMVENDYSWTVIDEARTVIRRVRGED